MDMRRFLLCGSWSAWSRVANPTQCCDAAPPEIAVKRCPHSRLLEVVTPVSLEATYGFLGLRPGDRQVVRRAIGGVKPHSGIGVEHPVTPTLRITELRLNCPPIDPPIDQLCGVVLARWCDYRYASAKKHLLLPFRELLRCHRRAALQIDEKTCGKVQQPRSVNRSLVP